ncbi:MAG: PD-(D/E)XK nuclease domain-containing protein, partial [Desulfovibrionaceae bacterium]|nr:PD-(D/E)XK nuclease domain-containing protein [Desulfovibrionaceae bacterium]
QSKLEKLSEAALDQIKEKKYDTKLKEKYDTIIYYGISFFEKRCLVKSEIRRNK